MTAQDLTLTAPLSGTLLSIESSADPVFAQRLVGDGIVIEPSSQQLLAPCAGIVSQLHEAGHAVAIKTATGTELLMHIGIDTVTLKGEGFAPKVEMGQAVTQGQPLIEFNKQLIEDKGLNAQVVVLLTSGETVAVQSYPRSVIANKDPLFAPVELQTSDQPLTQSPTSDEVQCISAELVIKNPQGLHARPAAQLVAVAKQFSSEITLTVVESGLGCIATSVTGIMGLQTKLNSLINVTVKGVDAPAALSAISVAIEDGLGENVSAVDESDEDEFPVEAPLLQFSANSGNYLQGIKAAQGISVGFLQYRHNELPCYPEEGVSVDEEMQQFDYGIGQAHSSLNQLVEKLNQTQMSTQAEVFSAHRQLLSDPALVKVAQQGIQQGLSATAAWYRAYSTEVKKLAALDNPLLKARAVDIEDVGTRVMRILLGVEDQTDVMPENTILVMEDITPSEIVSLDRDKVVGLVTIGGGSTSHAAILASSLNLPYIVNIPDGINQQPAGTRAILNANKGTIQLSPSDAEVSEFKTLQALHYSQLKTAQAHAGEAAVTEDGVTIEVAANAGSICDAINAAEAGADGIGLVRSEFLYLDRVSEPTLAEQTEVYKGILSGIGASQSCIIRTLDVGGDKPLAYLPLAAEENPFLGERGIRVGLNRPHMLRKQVRAILQAAQAGKPKIMFPMIASIEEFRAAKQLVQEEQVRAGIDEIEIGIMIEIPSAALMADKLAKEVDFFSIGTNDLTQYTLAMDRGHPKLAAQVDALHPAVLRLIHQTAQASIAEGKWTGICGSIASDPVATSILIGLGVTELSTSIPALPLIKEKIRHLSMDQCQFIARAALQKSTAAEVREMLQLEH